MVIAIASLLILFNASGDAIERIQRIRSADSQKSIVVNTINKISSYGWGRRRVCLCDEDVDRIDRFIYIRQTDEMFGWLTVPRTPRKCFPGGPSWLVWMGVCAIRFRVV